MYNVFGTLFGGQCTTANVIGVNSDYAVSDSNCNANAMHQYNEDTYEDEEGNSTSIESIASSNPLSEESEFGARHRWQEKFEPRAVNSSAYTPIFCQSDTPHNNLTDHTLMSLGYKAPDEWPELKCQARVAKPNLYELLSEIVQKDRKTNAVITIAQSSLQVHLIVLQCFSGLFCDLGNDTVNVELPSEWVTPRAFRLIYDWMIADAPLLSRLGLLEVLRAASFLRIPQLEKQCEHCLAHGITEESAVLLYLEARLLRMERTHRPLLQRVGRFFLTLVASQEFLQLPMHALWLLLSSNGIGVNTELEVFMAAVRWLNFQWPKRRLIIAQLISCVRFALVPPWLLIRLHDRHSTSIELKRIISQPEVLQQLHDGIGYTTTRLCYGSDRDAFMLHLERTGMQPPEQRNWIYDRECTYHHRLHCQISDEFPYEAFIGYLSWLQTQHGDYWQSLEPVDVSEVCLCCQTAAKELKETFHI